jgi:uncharacterized protein YgbK (DUF1537 family)
MIAALADDFTSALDGAAPFAGRGLSARVVLDVAAAIDSDVVSIDLDSRFAAPHEAEARFDRAARRMAAASLIYKTIDSTLRGNLAAEICGALRGSKRQHAMVAPAFPAAGRITRDGHQLINGIPVEKTAFARDPRTPVSSGKIAECLRGCDPLMFSIHDAVTDADLDTLVAKVSPLSSTLWVGSPGLGAALARALDPCLGSGPRGRACRRRGPTEGALPFKANRMMWPDALSASGTCCMCRSAASASVLRPCASAQSRV